ncbi:MAG: hypothetical protein OXB84_09325, partial [Halobacteriovoraceae bacterium]|nr:hypothetical protein [Halobacteriovoraceae bacterium]
AKFHLSTGEKIWDFSGNVWEWVDWTLGGELTSGPTTCPETWVTQTHIRSSCPELSMKDYSSNKQLSIFSDENEISLGLFMGGSGGAAIRGGSENDEISDSPAGVFALNLKYPSSYVSLGPHSGSPYIGFRCVYRNRRPGPNSHDRHIRIHSAITSP